MTDELRKLIQTTARSYLGVPWRHQGRTRSFGVDCVGLPIAVARDIGLTPEDWVSYGLQPDWRTFYRFLHTNTYRIGDAEAGPGDLALLQIDDLPHSAIVADGGAPLSIIHAWQPNGKVLEMLFDPATQQLGHARGFFRYRGLEALCRRRAD